MTAQAGFTLLEMLAVVAIMAAIAYVALDTLADDDGQRRFVETRQRLDGLRRAVVGTPERSVNGQPQIGGFVADVGRLPRCLEELLTIDADCNADSNPDTRQANPPAYDAASRTLVGWNGPYLPVMTSLGGLLFRDGWGNSPATGTTDSGWVWTYDPPVTDRDSATETYSAGLTVQSLGMDGATGGTSNYEADYPPSGDLVAQADHHLRVDGWSVEVTFRNDDATISTTATAFCIRLNYPRDGQVTETYTGTANTSVSILAAGAETSGLLQFPTGTAQWVPWGQRSLELLEDTSADCTSVTSRGTKPVQLIPRSALTAPEMTASWTSAGGWELLP